MCIRDRVYGLTPNYSVYASYTDVFTPQSDKNEGGDTLKPITGAVSYTHLDQIEFGRHDNAAVRRNSRY